jgi:hypothetical protein
MKLEPGLAQARLRSSFRQSVQISHAIVGRLAA